MSRVKFPVNIEDDNSCKIKDGVGYLSVHVPEEVIIAAGKVPFHILGSGKPVKMANAYLPMTFDPYVLDSADGIMSGKYALLDGVVIANVSDGHRRLYDVCKSSANLKNLFFLDVPKGADRLRLKSFKFAVTSLVREIENAFGCRIGEAELIDAIKLCNKTRELLASLNDLRKRTSPVCSGEQFFNIVRWCQSNDKRMVNGKLSLFLDNIKSSRIENETDKVTKPRIMIMGSVIGSPLIFSVIEGVGSDIVCEDLCVGTQYFAQSVDECSGDALGAIAKRYISIPTARMVDTEARWNYLLKTAEDFKVDGVIYFALKFDDIYLFEYPYIKEKFQAAGYPLLFVEAENFLSTLGQIETRVQAFVEMLGDEGM